jgi:peptidoglycan/xylan/chitin deacetylase (PgdA/CDA1 family)
VLVHRGVNHVDDGVDPVGLVVSPEQLESQLRFLQRLGYGFVRADELADRWPDRRPPARTAVLTFDDGWRDALTVVVPLLDRLGIPATFYINPGLFGMQHVDVTGEAGRRMTRDEARELAAAGMEVASHTMTHPDLRELSDHALEDELVRSKGEIEDITGARCRTFAYPFGVHDERVRRATEDAGYEIAFQWKPGPYERFAYPRLPAPARWGARRLALRMIGVHRRW